jgi:hypothetical protein
VVLDNGIGLLQAGWSCKEPDSVPHLPLIRRPGTTDTEQTLVSPAPGLLVGSARGRDGGVEHDFEIALDADERMIEVRISACPGQPNSRSSVPTLAKADVRRAVPCGAPGNKPDIPRCHSFSSTFVQGLPLRPS